MTYRPAAGQLPGPRSRSRRYKWDLSHDLLRLGRVAGESTESSTATIEAFKAFQGTLAGGPEALLDAFRAMDDMGALSYRVWYYASLQYDEDQRNNEINARRQQVQILFARQQQASSWFNPELLAIPLETIRQWMERRHAAGASTASRSRACSTSRSTCSTSRASGCCRMRAASTACPHDSYAALTTADMKFPSIALGGGEQVTLSYGQYRAHARDQPAPGGPADRVPGVSPGLRRQPEHLRGAVQRRAAARLVPRAGARVRDHARCGAARQQHPDVRGREPDRRHQGRRRAAAPLSPAAPARAGRRQLPAVRRLRPAGRARRALYLRRGRAAGSSSRWRRSAASTSSTCATAFSGALDRRVREHRASAAARTRRRCTARIRTCCSTTTRRSTRCSRSRTRWGIRCTRCWRIGRSRSSMPATRSSSPRCRRR